MYRNFAGTLVILVIAVSHSSTYSDDDEYSEENSDYDNDSEVATDFSHDVNLQLNLKGILRKRFVVDAALASPSSSLVCSPVSALLPLGKLALAAQGTCLAQLLNAIGVSMQSELKKAFKPLINALHLVKGVTLNIISKIYVSKKLKLQSEFKKKSKKFFDSTVVAMDFNSPADAARDINDWVSGNTRHMIPNIISEQDISKHTSILLVNAVYFSGRWKFPFTTVMEDNFYSRGAIRRMPMMSQNGHFKYTKSDPLDAQVVEIPYVDENISFIIFLPNSKHGLPVLLHKIKLAPALMERALEKLDSTDLILTIPKFKTFSRLDLTDVYKKLGVTDIFEERNSGLEELVRGDKNVHVSKAVQKAAIEVNELGTEAAAASISQIVAVSLNLNQKIFNANHPFMYIIKFKDEQLFSGVFLR